MRSDTAARISAQHAMSGYFAKQLHRLLQVAQIARMEQPQVHLWLEIADVEHIQRIAMAAGLQQRFRDQSQALAIGDQPQLQFGAEGLQIDRQAQPLFPQCSLQPRAETTSVGVEHPATGVAILEFVTAFASAAFGRHHLQRHACNGLAGDALREDLAWREQRGSRVQLAVLHARDQAAAPTTADLGTQLWVGFADPRQRFEQHHVPQRLRHAQAQGARRCAIIGHQFAQRVDLAQDRLALFVHPQSHGGGLERFGVAVEKGGAEVFLEILHPAGNGRLRQLQGLGGKVGGLATNDRDEGVHIIDFHNRRSNGKIRH
ncbi:protein of unknown function [Pseudomonas sp. JV551A1]|nr:protein of unknown function [Pseudomonas sp. JV551A1]